MTRKEADRVTNPFIVAGTIADGTGKPEYAGYLLIKDGKIAEAAAGEPGERAAGLPVFDAGEAAIIPGFVDIHCHGGGGGDFTDGRKASTEAAFLHHLRHGTTTLAATTMTASRAEIEQALSNVDEFRRTHEYGSMAAGVHLEGPFISPQFPGAQNPARIAKPNTEWLSAWIRAYPGLIRLITLAPEADGAREVIELAAEHGIAAACGHSNAVYEELREAIGWGLRHAVHCGNAMRGMHHREPGVFGGVLLHDELSTEVIVDGWHLHDAAVRLILKAKPGSVCLITDAMRASGWPDGSYALGGLEVTVTEGAARLGNGALAGSVLTMDRALANLIRITGLPLHKAVPLASSIPAAIIGEHGAGTLEAGKTADLLVIHRRTLQVEKVMLAGSWVETE